MEDYMRGYTKYFTEDYIEKCISEHEQEQWLQSRDMPEYEVSNLGRIRNSKTKRVLKTHVNERGYETVTITNNNKHHNIKVHRMVANTFYEGDHNNLDVNHIDGNKLNNHIDNLEYCTRSENIRHAFTNGFKNSDHKKQRVKIIETGEIFDSLTECARYLGCDKSAVSGCINGRSKTCGGYHLISID